MSAQVKSLLKVRMTRTPAYGTPDPRPGGGRLQVGDIVDLDLSDPVQLGFAQDGAPSWPYLGIFEVIDGEIPPSGDGRSPQPTPAAVEVDPDVAKTARRGSMTLRGAIAAVDERLRRRQTASDDAAAAFTAAKAALRELQASSELDGKVSAGAVEKAEAAVAAAKREHATKAAALEVETERTQRERAVLQEALALAVTLEGRAQVDKLAERFTKTHATFAKDMVAMANRTAELEELRAEHSLAAGRIGSRTNLPPVIAPEYATLFTIFREHFDELGLALGFDATTNRWTVTER